jgi:hypothetical protein
MASDARAVLHAGPRGPQGRKGDPGANGTDGATLNYRGVWSADEAPFAQHDAAQHLAAVYACTAANTSTQPTNLVFDDTFEGTVLDAAAWTAGVPGLTVAGGQLRSSADPATAALVGVSQAAAATPSVWTYVLTLGDDVDAAGNFPRLSVYGDEDNWVVVGPASLTNRSGGVDGGDQPVAATPLTAGASLYVTVSVGESFIEVAAGTLADTLYAASGWNPATAALANVGLSLSTGSSVARLAVANSNIGSDGSGQAPGAVQSGWTLAFNVPRGLQGSAGADGADGADGGGGGVAAVAIEEAVSDVGLPFSASASALAVTYIAIPGGGVTNDFQLPDSTTLTHAVQFTVHCSKAPGLQVVMGGADAFNGASPPSISAGATRVMCWPGSGTTWYTWVFAPS